MPAIRRERAIPSPDLRALVVTNMWPTAKRPGSGIFVSDQVDALRAAGIDVTVFPFEGGSPVSYMRAAWRLRREQAGEHFDVVHAHFGLSAWVALGARGRVRAVTFHGTDLSHPRSRTLSAAVLPFIDLPAAASADLASRVPSRQLRAPVQVLPCGVSLERFTPRDRAQSRRMLGIGQEERIVLFPADPSRPEKRADRAAALARRVEADLVTLGSASPEEVALRMNAADIVVITSEREGFGLAALEAVASGVPVMSTPHGVAPELLDGVPGTYCGEWDEESWATAASELMSTGARPPGRELVEPWSADSAAASVITAWSAALKHQRAG